MAAVAIAVHLIPFLTERGYPTGFAALTVSVLGGSQIPGRLVFAPLASRLSLRRMTAVLFIMMTSGVYPATTTRSCSRCSSWKAHKRV